jgi:tetratricopeptide (TPR) repeat protein
MIGTSMLAVRQGDYRYATELGEEVLALARAMGDKRWVAQSLGTLANFAVDQGKVARATAFFEEALALSQELEAIEMTAGLLLNLGRMLALSQGDHASATRLLEESLALWRQLDDPTGIVYTTLHIGFVAMMAGDIGTAAQRYREALRLAWAAGNRAMVGYGLVSLAGAAVMHGHVARAVRLFGAAEVLRDTLDAPWRRSNRYTTHSGSPLPGKGWTMPPSQRYGRRGGRCRWSRQSPMRSMKIVEAPRRCVRTERSLRQRYCYSANRRVAEKTKDATRL